MSNKKLYPYVDDNVGYKLMLCNMNAKSLVPLISSNSDKIVPTEIKENDGQTEVLLLSHEDE